MSGWQYSKQSISQMLDAENMSRVQQIRGQMAKARAEFLSPEHVNGRDQPAEPHGANT